MAAYTLPVNTGRFAVFSNPGQGAPTAAKLTTLAGVDPDTNYASVASSDGKTVFYLSYTDALVYKWNGSTFASHSSFTPSGGIRLSRSLYGLDSFVVSPDGLEVVFFNTANTATKVWRNTSGTTWAEVYSFSATFPLLLQIAADGLTVAYVEEPTVSGWDHDKVTILTKSGGVWSSTGTISTALPTQNMDSYCYAMALSPDGMTIAYSPDHTPAVRFYTRSGTTWSASTAVTTADYPGGLRFSPSGTKLLAFYSLIFSELTLGLTAWSITTSSVSAPSGQDWSNGFLSVGEFDTCAIETYGSSQHVEVYKRVSGVLTWQQSLTADSAGSPDVFALIGLSPDGKTIMASAWGENTFDSSHFTNVYLFDYSGSSWSKTQKLYDPAQAAGFAGQVAPAGGLVGSSFFSAGPANWLIERGTVLTYAAVAAAAYHVDPPVFALALGTHGPTLTRGKTLAVQSASYVFGGSWKSGLSGSKTDLVQASTNPSYVVISGDGLTVMHADTDYSAPFISIYDLSSGTPVQQTNFQVLNSTTVFVKGMQLSDNGNTAVVMIAGGVYILERTGGTWGAPTAIFGDVVHQIPAKTLSLSTDGSLIAFDTLSTGTPYGDGYAALRKTPSGWVQETIAYIGDSGWATNYGHFGALSGDGQHFIGVLSDSTGTSVSILPYHYASGAWVADTPITIPGGVSALSSAGVDRTASKIALQIYVTGFVLKTRVYDISSGTATQIGGDIPFTDITAPDAVHPSNLLSLSDDGLQVGAANGNTYEYVGGAWVATDNVAATDRIMFYGGMSRRGNVRVVGDPSTAHAGGGYDRKFSTRRKAGGFDVAWNRSNNPAYHLNYTINKPDVGLLYKRVVSAVKGTYTFSGKAVTFPRTRTLSPTTYALAITAYDPTLSRTGAKVLGVPKATFAVSAFSPTLKYARVAAVAATSYSVAAYGPTLTKFRGIQVSAGAFTFAGHAATLTYVRGHATAHYVMAVSTVTMKCPTRHLYPPATGYNITGNAAALSKGAAKIMAVSKGVFAVTTYSADLRRPAMVFRPATKAFSVTGYSPSLGVTGRSVLVTKGAYTVAPFAATMQRGRIEKVAAGTYTVQGYPASYLRGRVMHCDTVNYALGTHSALLYKSGALKSPAINLTVMRKDHLIYVGR